MPNKIIAIDEKTGRERTFSEKSWREMGNKKDSGDVRRGWRFIREVNGKGETVVAAKQKTPLKTNTFQPPAVKTGNVQAADQPPAAPAKPEQMQSAEVQSELTSIEGIGNKSAEILAGAGVTTIAQLAQADQTILEAAMAAGGMEAKAKNVVKWIASAKDRIKAQA